MCPYVRNTRYMVLFMTIYTDQKLEKTPLMVVSEQSERAEIFALLRQKHMFFFIPTRKPETWEKAIHDCEQAIFFVCVSETCDSSQYFVGESHSLSVQCVLLFVTLVIWSYSWRFIPTRNVPETREKPINGYERAERASRNFLHFCVIASETYMFFLTDRKTRN